MAKKEHIVIFTTASLSWMTGTAVNPLFRAAYLAKDGHRKLTLVIPWLSKSHQEYLYPNKMTFNSPTEQEKYVREWIEQRTELSCSFNMHFYPGRFSRSKRSILALGDITESIPDEESNIAILEEPEHLTWYHHGSNASLACMPYPTIRTYLMELYLNNHAVFFKNHAHIPGHQGLFNRAVPPTLWRRLLSQRRCYIYQHSDWVQASLTITELPKNSTRKELCKDETRFVATLSVKKMKHEE